eukprot:GILK01002518.1.p1 GENE.GILK01002518.1~~GILK01002518.1.p1  ORF type:complete len:422 (-),score=66.05 GILK01002518.1:45-1310(-)
MKKLLWLGALLVLCFYSNAEGLQLQARQQLRSVRDRSAKELASDTEQAKAMNGIVYSRVMAEAPPAHYVPMASYNSPAMPMPPVPPLAPFGSTVMDGSLSFMPAFPQADTMSNSMPYMPHPAAEGVLAAAPDFMGDNLMRFQQTAATQQWQYNPMAPVIGNNMMLLYGLGLGPQPGDYMERRQQMANIFPRMGYNKEVLAEDTASAGLNGVSSPADGPSMVGASNDGVDHSQEDSLEDHEHDGHEHDGQEHDSHDEHDEHGEADSGDAHNGSTQNSGQLPDTNTILATRFYRPDGMPYLDKQNRLIPGTPYNPGWYMSGGYGGVGGTLPYAEDPTGMVMYLNAVMTHRQQQLEAEQEREQKRLDQQQKQQNAAAAASSTQKSAKGSESVDDGHDEHEEHNEHPGTPLEQHADEHHDQPEDH